MESPVKTLLIDFREIYIFFIFCENTKLGGGGIVFLIVFLVSFSVLIEIRRISKEKRMHLVNYW